MPQPPIPIIGAGLAGLTLSRCLLHHAIPSIIYEKAPKKASNNYAITLNRSTYQPLLSILKIDEADFKQRVGVGVAVDDAEREIGGGADSMGTTTVRVNRAKLEEVLREGLDIRWNFSLQSIDTTPTAGTAKTESRLHFANGEELQTAFFIGADGVHSQLRNLFLPPPASTVQVLPYVVYNGKRRVDRSVFDTEYATAGLGGGGGIVQVKHKDALFRISLDSLGRGDGGGEVVGISWTYSRPAHPSSSSSPPDPDPLFRPNRSLASALEIPEPLFAELVTMSTLLPPLLSARFTTDILKKDRILHWLMRTTATASLPVLQRLMKETGACMVGDAIHAQPILGGKGANAAMEDGVSLAEAIAAKGRAGVEGWYEERFEGWRRGVEESKGVIGEMHRVEARQAGGNL
ncbi:FAD-dependent monooxygenase [Pyrenophora seminiperda CCB06]|uniref:FAD-dependent monooxygenase n=1 Tax=Pyrenophora seminiperda CCB06 TaxID=1302712 RepID=A0A3M7LZJ1_9PLEO|nr:FAD-dependent monooxygenase [Pyrenophora seminiperda CCB06]